MVPLFGIEPNIPEKETKSSKMPLSSEFSVNLKGKSGHIDQINIFYLESCSFISSQEMSPEKKGSITFLGPEHKTMVWIFSPCPLDLT